jgi:hypothetical protein
VDADAGSEAGAVESDIGGGDWLCSGDGKGVAVAGVETTVDAEEGRLLSLEWVRMLRNVLELPPTATIVRVESLGALPNSVD